MLVEFLFQYHLGRMVIFSVDSLVIRMLLSWLKQLNVVLYFYFTTVPAPAKPVAAAILPSWNVTLLPFLIFIHSPVVDPF